MSGSQSRQQDLCGEVAALIERGGLRFLVVFTLIACGSQGESRQPPATESSLHLASSAPSEPEAAPVRAEIPPSSPVAKPREHMQPSLDETHDPELRGSLNRALLEYRSAFVGRDMEKLEKIWTMSPVERLLIEKAWSNCQKIELSLETVSIHVGKTFAEVDFDQDLTFLCPNESRTSHSMLSASLERQGDGQWKISRIGDRQAVLVAATETVPARLASRATTNLSDEGMNRALETLSDYETALQNCDIKGLARVWIMNDLERQILQGLCFRTGHLEVSISEPQISSSGGRLSIDFTHDFTKRGSAGPTQTRSRLTALFVERDDGNLAIWKIRAAE